ncbi:sirohydrochlorin chelatase [Streptomyces sp. NPDC002685]|uniref:sirohydrochlorin chelatase n=1 Tax=Streptomyces sp. NPDC002685 TaxID=3154540 RepID=UPI00332C9B60
MPPVLLAVAHGSRDPRHAETLRGLVRQVRARRPELRVEIGFLDFAVPSVRRVLAELAEEVQRATPGQPGAVREVVAVPLLLSRAFHAKADIPAVLRQAPPELRIEQAGVLGPAPLLSRALERRLYEAGLVPGDMSSTGVVLASAGTSDREANAVIADIAREWRSTGWCAVRPAFASFPAGGSASGSGPGAVGAGTAWAVRRLRALGCARVAVASYVLAPGFLMDRIARGAVQADVIAPVLGDAPEVVELVLHRFDQACSRFRVTAAVPGAACLTSPSGQSGPRAHRAARGRG